MRLIPTSSILAGLLLAAPVVGDFAPVANATEVADRILRYVNEEVITIGDVWQRMRDRYLELRQSGQPLPRTKEDLDAMQAEILEELTEEVLLLQEAVRLEIQVNREGIRREVQEWIKDNNLSPTIEQEITERERRERQGRLFTVLRYYSLKWAGVSPADIKDAYEQEIDRYARPPRARCLRILMRPAGAAERRARMGGLLRLFKAVQVDQTPAISGSIGDEVLSAYVRADEDARADIIAQALQGTLAAAPEQVPVPTARLLRQIQEALAGWKAQRSPEDVEAALTEMRIELLALTDPVARRARFAEMALNESQGPKAANGGDLGWFEPGSEAGVIDEFAFSSEVGALSDLFDLEGFRGLLLLAELDDSGPRPLAEVSAEISARLENENLAKLRATITGQLRRQSHIEDLPVEAVLPEGWLPEDDRNMLELRSQPE